MSKTIKLEAGEVLINEGEKKQDLFWVQKGELAVYQKRASYEIHLDKIHAGELIGELAVIDQLPRSATIKAITACEIIQYSNEELKDLFEAQPQIVKILLQTLVERLRKTTSRLQS
ncbi:MAG: Crp/Fnr family transcriptional regulator [Bacteriovoracaceae bacterium]